MATREQATMSVDGDAVVVTGALLLVDRRARLFFSSVIGAEQIEGGWRCPRRRQSLATLILRINAFLETKGWRVQREGLADEEVRRALERKRSFERTRSAASALEQGVIPLDPISFRNTLREFGWNSEARPLLPHQESGAIHGLTAINAANFSVPGSGKTSTSLAVATAHLASGTIDLVLVVGPLACFAPWEREADAALPGRFRSKRVRGTSHQRRGILGSAQKHDLLLMSYAGAAADKSQVIDLCHRLNVLLVVDESHRVKRFRGGIWAPALLEIARHARVRLILSGTPMPQGGRDLYSQLNILWPHGELTGPRDVFGARVDLDFDAVIADVKPFVSRAAKDSLGLPPYEVVHHEIEMSPTQAEIYLLIEGHFRRRLEDAHQWQDKLAVLRRGRPIRLLQAACNPDLLNRVDSFYSLPRLTGQTPTLMERLMSYRGAETPGKSQAALELIRQIASAGQKAVVWSNFLINLDQFTELVRSRLGVPCFQVDGRVPTGDESIDEQQHSATPHFLEGETREQIIERFLDTAGAAVLVTNPASCSESISLHRSCHNAIYLDRTYDAALYLQSIDRIHRLGLPPGTSVTVHLLHAIVNGRRSCDHLVDVSLSRKEATMRQLLEGAALRPLHLSSDPLVTAEGNDEDLADLLRFLLGEPE
jgi:SNF2 family DNA or RNA helicase